MTTERTGGVENCSQVCAGGSVRKWTEEAVRRMTEKGSPVTPAFGVSMGGAGHTGREGLKYTVVALIPSAVC